MNPKELDYTGQSNVLTNRDGLRPPAVTEQNPRAHHPWCVGKCTCGAVEQAEPDPEDTEFSLSDEPVTDEMLLDRYKDHRPEVKALREALEEIKGHSEARMSEASEPDVIAAHELVRDIARKALGTQEKP